MKLGFACMMSMMIEYWIPMSVQNYIQHLACTIGYLVETLNHSFHERLMLLLSANPSSLPDFPQAFGPRPSHNLLLYWQIELLPLQYSTRKISASYPHFLQDHHGLTSYNKSRKNPNTAPSAQAPPPTQFDPHTPPQNTYTANSGYTAPDTTPVQTDNASLSSRPPPFSAA